MTMLPHEQEGLEPKTKNVVCIGSKRYSLILLASEQVDQATNALVDSVVEQQRLAELSNKQLVAECLASDAADYDVVIEMMDRLDPEWSKEINV